MQEEEGKGKELDSAKAESAKFQAKLAKDAHEIAKKEAKKKIDAENKANFKPDGTIHKDGKRYFTDASGKPLGVVGGVNTYAQI